MKSIIKLFKALPVDKKGKETSRSLLKETIKRGFVFSPEVIYNYSESELKNFIKIIEKELGITGKQANSSFHKSWKKIKEASIEQLVLEQMVHYITTYGFESLGIYKQDSVYIPTEKLIIPKIKVDKINLLVIKGYTKQELKKKLLSLLESGVALKEETKKDIVDVATFVDLKEDEINNIRNKEVRVMLYDYFNLFPQNPIEFLRFMVYKSTNRTLLIKDKATIEEIKSKDNLNILNLLCNYNDKHGLSRLSEIFYRFKPLFLAFRVNHNLKIIINKIRKLAYKYHKPMKEDYLNEVTAKIKSGNLDKNKLMDELSKVSVFRKIRLAYALKFRTECPESILYKIRNGKSYATSFKFGRTKKHKEILDIVMDSILEDIKPNVKNKKIYIPEYIKYTLPATEKQFVGYLPSGTCVAAPKNFVTGVHWENVNHHRIDLDLSLLDIDGNKIGWDGSYRGEEGKTLFSGDITDAPLPNGASELFYVASQSNKCYLLSVNYFNHEEDVEVPFKVFVSKEQIRNGRLENNYMVNPNDIICISKTSMKEKQKILGLMITDGKECKFYFIEANIGNAISSSDSDYMKHSLNYLQSFYKNSISLNDVLLEAGAKIVENEKKCDIDLSPEKLEKDTILNLLINRRR